MNKKKIKLEEMGGVNPFKMPENYFEDFTENMMSRLPERVSSEPQPVRSLWNRMQPFVYMAAMFAGIALMIRLFVGSPEAISRSNTLNLSSSAEIDEFYEYYEEQIVKSYYRETAYLSSEDVTWSEE